MPLRTTASSPFAKELAVIVNEADPLSVEIARYYQQARGIPAQNMIVVSFNPQQRSLSPEDFKALKAAVDAKTPEIVQGFALTWAEPYQVGCMSITAALTFGYDQRFCAKGCELTQPSPYFNQDSTKPYTDFRMRPTMAIAATNFEQAKALIDRGIAADGTNPKGTAYLLSTSDKTRNRRAPGYQFVTQQIAPLFNSVVIKSDALENKRNVMFYFTGVIQVKKLETNQFRPGAIADHLTSFGGALTNSSQMSSLRWLEAGATGSYGTVVEPCNFPQKFPFPAIAMHYYLQGNTLLQAYWKSVAQPGQGIFIGEPLARPFGK
ncbi:TIGR03790 family protein [Phormidium sp. CLA17]|nr:TIGR03790 family protein [Leptolyngbya sp. Cla-17]